MQRCKCEWTHAPCDLWYCFLFAALTLIPHALPGYWAPPIVAPLCVPNTKPSVKILLSHVKQVAWLHRTIRTQRVVLSERMADDMTVHRERETEEKRQKKERLRRKREQEKGESSYVLCVRVVSACLSCTCVCLCVTLCLSLVSGKRRSQTTKLICVYSLAGSPRRYSFIQRKRYSSVHTCKQGRPMQLLYPSSVIL